MRAPGPDLERLRKSHHLGHGTYGSVYEVVVVLPSYASFWPLTKKGFKKARWIDALEAKKVCKDCKKPGTWKEGGRWECQCQGGKISPAKTVAVKVLADPKRPGVPHNACREIGMLKELHHPNIVALLDVIVDLRHLELNLVLELASYDLQLVLHAQFCAECSDLPPGSYAYDQQTGMAFMHHNSTVGQTVYHRMRPTWVKSIIFQILNGAAYMHAQWIFNRDLKPANCLVTDGVVKLADFGLARIFHAPPRPLIDDNVVVTNWYRAPELLLGSRHYTYAIDIWSIGAILGELLVGVALFRGDADDNNNPFNASMVRKQFEKLGKPDAQDWPAVEDMPYWREAQAIVGDHVQPYRERKDRFVQELRSRQPCDRDMVELLLELLAYSPANRITCKGALEKYFSNFEKPDLILVPDATVGKTKAHIKKLHDDRVEKEQQRLQQEAATKKHKAM